MGLLQIPGFWKPEKVSEWFTPDLRLAREEARRLKLSPAKQQEESGDGHLLVIIDAEWGFTEKGTLPVKGMFADMVRLGNRIIRGILEEFYTSIIVSIDSHPARAIHNDAWWIELCTNLPPDVTIPRQMRLADETTMTFEALWPDGTSTDKWYRPRFEPSHTVKYAKHLIATGQGHIWVFADHCRQATDGACLVPAIAELLEWASIARDIVITFLKKGHVPRVDWFGPFQPCMAVPDLPHGGLQIEALEEIRKAQTTDFTGEAKDFCFFWGINQAGKYYAGDPAVLEKMRVINDCTSPIVKDGTRIQELNQFISEKHIKVIKHDDPLRM